MRHIYVYCLAYPQRDPRIEGMQETYLMHDVVGVNCTAAPSNPAPTLYWYINNLKVLNQSFLLLNKIIYLSIYFKHQLSRLDQTIPELTAVRVRGLHR